MPCVLTHTHLKSYRLFAKQCRIQLIMGGRQSVQSFPESKYYSVTNGGYCKIWKRRDTNAETMEQYDIHIADQQSLADYRKMWALRTQEEAVVMAYYFTHNTPNHLCGSFQQGSILTERIPYRLSQFGNIPYAEIIPILRTALKAYKVLHEEYGLFQVRSTMIGINTAETIKVWHHTDFSSATPQNVNCRNLETMVDSIIKSVEINADIPEQYSSFSEFLKTNRNMKELNFESVLLMLSSYKRLNRIHKRKGLAHLTNHLRQDEKAEDNHRNNHSANNLSKINQANSSSADKFSFRNSTPDSSSVHSSRKTVKNKNIYTHKDTHQLRPSYHTPHSKSQNFGSPPSKLEIIKHNSNILNHSPSPRLSQRQSSIISQSKNLQPIQVHKISFKLVNQGNTGQQRFAYPSESKCSLDQQSQFLNPPFESIYTQHTPNNQYRPHLSIFRPVEQDARSNSGNPNTLSFKPR